MTEQSRFDVFKSMAIRAADCLANKSARPTDSLLRASTVHFLQDIRA
jgi:hypothetical protein